MATVDVETSPVLIEVWQGPGTMQVALNPAELAAKSAEALDHAMGTIRQMAQRVASTITTLPERPAHAEVEFGLKIDAQGQALVAKAGAEANIKVKLTWDR